MKTLLALVLIAGAATANAGDIIFPDVTHIKIDGLYYPVTQVITAGSCAILAPGVQATTCRRIGGQAQQQSLAVMLVNPNYFPVYVRADQDLIIDQGILYVASQTGDIICNGAVPPPVGSSLFANGFE